MNLYGFLIILILIIIIAFELVVEKINRNYVKKTSNNPTEEVFRFYTSEILTKSAKYFESKSNIETYAKILYYIIFFIFLISGIFQWFSIEIINIVENEYIRAALFFAGYQLFFAILGLPFDIYQTFKIEKEFNFNRITPSIYIKDLIINALLSFIILTIILSIVITFINVSGNYWYIYASVAVVIFYIFLMYLYPVFIAPLFNKFEPLKNKELENKVFSLANIANFPIKNILQMDASKRSSHSNAFFAGFGRSRRIILFDTLLKNHSDEEILAILSHEIGHYKKRHIQKTFILIFILILLFFSIAGFLINTKFIYNALGFEKTIFTGLFIISIILSPISTIIKPVLLYLSRKHEHEADKFALLLINDKETIINTLVKLHKDNLSYPLPHPLYVKLHYSHPPLIKRIEKLCSI